MQKPIVPMTPMQKRYTEIKATLPKDTLLMIRLGDFYEFFFEDAVIAAPILKTTLTKRNGLPMCGIPAHAVHTYTEKLALAGKEFSIWD